jgi:hypothetical protein
MIIRCTHKLLAELKIEPRREEHTSNQFWSWHAKLFQIERRKCVLITNDTTLFTIFIPGLKKPDFASFGSVIGQHLFKNLLFEHIPQSQIEPVLSECENIKFQKTDNRSVLGSMNDHKFRLERIVADTGGLERIDIFELNTYLNRNFLSAIGYRRPIEILKEQLSKLEL